MTTSTRSRSALARPTSSPSPRWTASPSMEVALPRAVRSKPRYLAHAIAGVYFAPTTWIWVESIDRLTIGALSF